MAFNKTLSSRLFLALILILLFTHTSPGSSHDSSRMAMIENLITKHVWWTEGSRYFNGVDMVMDGRHFYSDKPPIFALYSALIAYPLKYFVSFDTQLGRKIYYYFITITSSGMALIGLCLLMQKALLHFKVADLSRDGLILASITGTCMLPMALIYVTHTTEALLLFATFLALVYYADRRESRYAYWMGLSTGLNMMVHPFVGGMYLMITAGYLLIEKRWKDLARFTICAGLLGLTTLGINQVLFHTPRPYYTMPEKYLFLVTDGKKVYPSGFMLYPSVQGLTEAMVARKFEEEGYPTSLMKQTLQRLREYKKNVKTHWEFAKSNWMMWDFIYFNPLVMYCIFLAVKNMWKSNSARRRLGAWILTGIFGLYISTIFQRSMPGGSFGNRYLVAALPPLFVFAAEELRCSLNKRWFILLCGVTIPGALLGSIHPWHTPLPSFRYVSMPMYLFTGAMVGLSVIVSPSNPINRLVNTQKKSFKYLFILFCGAWSVVQIGAYYWDMRQQLYNDVPSIMAKSACFIIAILVWQKYSTIQKRALQQA